MTDQERKAAQEHHDTLLAVRGILLTKDGRFVMKYLLKSFGVGELPEKGLEGMALHDEIGFLRAGNSIFKLAAEASPSITGELLAEIEKDRYNALLDAQRVEREFREATSRTGLE